MDTDVVRKAFCATFKNVDIAGKEISKSGMLRFLLEAAELEEKAKGQVVKLEEKVKKFIGSPPPPGEPIPAPDNSSPPPSKKSPSKHKKKYMPPARVGGGFQAINSQAPEKNYGGFVEMRSPMHDEDDYGYDGY